MPTVFQLRDRVATMQLSYSTEKREYLEERRRGADNKDRGTEFERHYGVYHLMRGAFNAIVQNSDGSRFFVSNNLVADVDDLYVSGDDELVLAQAKDRIKLGWPEVEERFEEQLAELKKFNLLRHSRVKLVVSKKELQVSLLEKRPEKLAEVEVEHFQNASDDFLPYAEILVAKAGDGEAMANARQHYYDAWRALDFSASVGDVAFRANQLTYGNIRMLRPAIELPEPIKEALKKVEFLRSEVIGDRLYYAFQEEELAPQRWIIGSPKWASFVEALSVAKGLDYMGFLKLMVEIR